MGASPRRVNFSEMSYTEKPLLRDYSFYEEYLQHELIPRLDALAGAARNLGSEFVIQRSYFFIYMASPLRSTLAVLKSMELIDLLWRELR